MASDLQRLTDIDLTDLSMGEKLIIYRGSNAFLSGPAAAGYVGEATVMEVQRRSAILKMPDENALRQGQPFEREYRLRLRDGRICRVPNGEVTMLYVHARGGRPTVTAYFTHDEYVLVKTLLLDEASSGASTRSRRWAASALQRMQFHDDRRRMGR